MDLSKQLNPHTVAGVLKLFFTELTNPIIPHELYPALIEACGLKDLDIRLWCIRQVVDVLPPGNRIVLQRVTSTFGKIAEFSEENKMSAVNIAIVMNPAFFRDPAAISISSFVENGGVHVKLIEMMIIYNQEIFIVRMRS